MLASVLFGSKVHREPYNRNPFSRHNATYSKSTSGGCRPSYCTGHRMPFFLQNKSISSVNWDIFICKDINVMHTPLIFSNKVLIEAVGVLIIVAVCDFWFFFFFFSKFDNAIGLLVWKARRMCLPHRPALWRRSFCHVSDPTNCQPSSAKTCEDQPLLSF